MRNLFSCFPRSDILSACCAPLLRAEGSRGLLIALVLIAPLWLTGCLVQSDVQGRYVEDQGECRAEAESNIGRYAQSNLTAKERNAKLVTLFSNCMGKRGWQVAKPKRVKTATNTNGPHGPLDPYPSAAGTAVATTTTTTTAGPVQPPISGPQYQQEQQRLLQEQKRLAMLKQGLDPNSPEAASITRQQQEVARQQAVLAQSYQQQQKLYESVAPQRPVSTTTTPLSPSGGMPPLAQPSTDGGAYYQPRGGNAYLPSRSGAGGAGRNF